MDSYEAREKIEKLAAAIARVELKAMREERNLTNEEDSLCQEMRGSISALRDLLPEKPLSQPGAHLGGNGSYNSTRASSGPFKSFGDQMNAVMMAGIPGAQIDQRLYAAATGTNESVASDGGFLVQTDLSKDIYKAAFETGKLAKLCRRIPISGNSNSIKIPGLDETSRAAGSRQGGVRSYWTAEAGELTASAPKFRVVELILQKLAILVYATDELTLDFSALENFLYKAAVDEMGFAMDDGIVNGTGAGQGFLGILNSGALVTVPAETGQASSTILPENLFKMWSRMIGSARQNSVFLINQNIESMLYSMSLSVGTGGIPVFMPAGGMSAQPYMTLFGRPVIPCEHCASIGTVGDIILASFPDGYVIAEKGGIQSDMSIHVRYVWDEKVFRYLLRISGQPMLAAPVEPYKGGASYTQSHFVALASR